MLIAERQSRIAELIAQRGISDLETIAAALGVSQSTVRRDIEALEQRGLVKRTHGGAIWVGDRGNATARPYAFDHRMAVQLDPKRAIASAAAKLIEPGQTALLDGGTTTFYLAEKLLGMTLQLVTNSLPIANLFLNDENIELILIGGLLYPRYGVLLGPAAEHALDSIHTKTLFLSVAGIHAGSMYNQNLLLVQSERRMMDQAQQIVLLADSSKFGQQALARLAALEEVDIVVSDAAISPEARQQVLSAGCQLIIAEA